MKVYCRKCASGTAYVSMKPKFCSQCGNSFETSAVASRPAPAKPNRTVVPQETSNFGFEIEEDSSANFNSMSKLDCEIQKPSNRRITLGDIAGTSEEESQLVDRPKAYTRKRVSKKQVLADFQAEAGQSRESSEI